MSSSAGKLKTRTSRARGAAKPPAGRGKVGAAFDDFLQEEGVYEETQAIAIKRVIAWMLVEEMRKQGLTKTVMAKRMNTSRSQLDRLLDPENTDVKLDTLARAAKALNRELRLKLAAA